MVNDSKAKDPRYWAKWRESGAVGNYRDAEINETFDLIMKVTASVANRLIESAMCRNARPYIEKYASGELDDGVDAEGLEKAESHLVICKNCRTKYNALAKQDGKPKFDLEGATKTYGSKIPVGNLIEAMDQVEETLDRILKAEEQDQMPPLLSPKGVFRTYR